MVSIRLTTNLLAFNIIIAILFAISYQFMVWLFSVIINRNSWDYFVLFIGYVPLRGVGYVIVPNFPFFVIVFAVIVNSYFLLKLRRSKE